LDYTLATSEEKEARLDVILGLVPPAKVRENSKDSDDMDESLLAQVGGWDCYMAPHDDEDDPAVYRSGSSKNKGKGPEGNEAPTGSQSEPYEGDEDDGSTLLATQPGFNKLLMVLRDEQVMRFVKYVSAAAPGSRWDICGEYEVGMVADESESEKV
jgi:hypothetical protein